MRLYICGDDPRSLCLKEIAKETGHQLTEKRPDAVVLPLPKAGMKDIRRYFPQGQKIICGMVEEELKETAKKEKWKLMNVLEDEGFLLENAQLTAEGAVYKAMQAKKGALCRRECLVVGYGRIGRYLTQMLRGLGSRVTVAARKEKARHAAGENSVSIEDIPYTIGRMDCVFNTVPSLVITENALEKVKKQALLMELASQPYGVDMAAAERLHVPVQIEGGLPGRYCPMDAARAWLDYIERSNLL